MSWWCSTTNQAWSWSWQPYPGVWLFVLALVVVYVMAVRNTDQLGKPTGQQMAMYGAGVFAAWLAADWPVGALGAGYLLSVHQLQYVLFVMVAPPLMLLGTPSLILARFVNRRRVKPVMMVLTRPVTAILLCNAIVVLTHFPTVVDGFMQSQLGSFALDMAWFFAGFILWWPAVQRVTLGAPLTYAARFVYLLVVTLVPGIPAAFFFFARFPIYRTYELAPPLGLATVDDQFVGGIVMKFGSFIVVLIALSILFYRWHATDRSPQTKLVLPQGTARW